MKKLLYILFPFLFLSCANNKEKEARLQEIAEKTCICFDTVLASDMKAVANCIDSAIMHGAESFTEEEFYSAMERECGQDFHKYTQYLD